MFGACLISEGEPIVIGDDCIVMEQAVIRGASADPGAVVSHSEALFRLTVGGRMLIRFGLWEQYL